MLQTGIFCVFWRIIFSVKNMKIFKKENLKVYLLGLLIGAVNGMLGAGGGMIAVPALKKLGFSQAEAQANAIAVILPISILSAALYLMNGSVTLRDAWLYIPGGIIGALIGTFLLSKIPQKWLRKIFAAFMIWAGIRLLTN